MKGGIESLYGTPGTNITLYVNYTGIKKKKRCSQRVSEVQIQQGFEDSIKILALVMSMMGSHWDVYHCVASKIKCVAILARLKKIIS